MFYPSLGLTQTLCKLRVEFQTHWRALVRWNTQGVRGGEFTPSTGHICANGISSGLVSDRGLGIRSWGDCLNPWSVLVDVQILLACSCPRSWIFISVCIPVLAGSAPILAKFDWHQNQMPNSPLEILTFSVHPTEPRTRGQALLRLMSAVQSCWVILSTKGVAVLAQVWS